MLGIGGLGRVIALELASAPHVTDLVLVDKRGDRSKAMSAIGRAVTITALARDVARPDQLGTLLKGVDVAVNATPPENNLAVMGACLAAGCDYVDAAGLSPLAPGEAPGILEQLRRDPEWRSAGRTALVSMGSDPGISNVMARACADRLTSLDEIRILKGATGGGEAQDYPLYSRGIFLRDAVSPPTVWEHGQLVAQPFVSGLEDYTFPPPVGRKRVYQFHHEEVVTLPLRLGREVGRVCYKHDINEDLVRSIVAMNALGLLAPDKRIKVGLGQTTFREAFLATFPEPSTLVGPLAGAIAIVAEVRGTRPDGSKGLVRGSIVLEHREANRKRGTTAERYLTSALACAGVALLGEKKVRPGVVAPEELPSDLIRPQVEARDVRFSLEDAAA